MFNLAELICNEIKLAIILGHCKNQEETQFYLDQLTNITEVCHVKSKTVNPSLTVELIGCQKNQNQQNGFQKIGNQHKKRSRKNKNAVSQIPNKTIHVKSTSNNRKPVFKLKPRNKNQRSIRTAIRTG